ncbi:MAG: DUF1572 domain-containing protein [Ferruginibacter sp.]
MTQQQYLSSRIREVFLNGKWIAHTNYKEQLDHTRFEEAVYKNGNTNSIALLTWHINYYLEGLLQVFEGGPLSISDKYSFDMPEPVTETGWKHMKETLFANAAKFADHVADMTEEKLASVFVKENYGSYLRNIEAVIEHSYYHLGQIVLLKKIMTATNIPA